jgi:hypothetical protein
MGSEQVELSLQIVKGGRGGVRGEPAFEGLVEAFGTAARIGDILT